MYFRIGLDKDPLCVSGELISIHPIKGSYYDELPVNTALLTQLLLDWFPFNVSGISESFMFFCNRSSKFYSNGRILRSNSVVPFLLNLQHISNKQSPPKTR